jgi:hypothetical protein
MERLTHTKRRDFLNCPRYFYHRHEQGLKLRLEKGGRRRGSAFGDALQAARDWQAIADAGDDLRTGEPGPHADEPAYHAHDPVHAAMVSLESSYGDLEETVNTQEEMDTLELEHVKLRGMVAAYIERYGLKARREVEFDEPFPAIRGRSTTFRLAGKIDGFEVVGPKTGRVIEDKFVSQIQKAMIDRLPLDAQTSEYVDALRSKGWAAEVAYRHTRYPGINPSKAKEYKTKPDVPAESLDAFEDRLRQDVLDRPEFYFDEQILQFPAVHLEDYRQGRYGTARLILQARALTRQHGFMVGFPMNPSRCWEFGGCEFIPLCTKADGAIDRYVVVPDNVELGRSSDDGITDEYGPTAGA